MKRSVLGLGGHTEHMIAWHVDNTASDRLIYPSWTCLLLYQREPPKQAFDFSDEP
jgi:hypothetical protein